MLALLHRCTPILLVLFALTCIDFSAVVDSADARSRSGGRSFSSPATRQAPQQQAPSQMNQRQQQTPQTGGFGRGLMGGLVGGALGAMLFGSLFGASGSANFLSRSTAVLAAVFFVTTLALAYFGNARPASSGSVLETPAVVVPSGAPAAGGADAVPAAPAAPASGAAQIPTK